MEAETDGTLREADTAQNATSVSQRKRASSPAPRKAGEASTQSTSSDKQKPILAAPLKSNDGCLSEDFLAFRNGYLAAFFCGSAADWLKGPYIYRLYEARGFHPSEITILFAAGYTASAVFGLLAGILADTLGRRRMCLVFCFFYAVHGALHLFSSFGVLLFARTLSGIATALLFSAFEAWMVCEHHKRFRNVDLAGTFSVQTQGNALVAAVSGITAQGAVHLGGYTAPMLLTLPLLGLCALQVYRWPENVGTRGREPLNIRSTANAILSDMNSVVFRVGALQCLFEGSMHIFVFLWTPILQHGGQTVPHGLIFTVFMGFFYLGGGTRLGIPLGYTFVVASLSLIVPCACGSFWWNLVALCVFEWCCGSYYPQIAVLRSKCFAESSRNATITLFRVPLNGIVVGTLLWGRSYPPHQLLLVASCSLFIGACIYATLPAIVDKAVVKEED